MANPPPNPQAGQVLTNTGWITPRCEACGARCLSSFCAECHAVLVGLIRGYRGVVRPETDAQSLVLAL